MLESTLKSLVLLSGWLLLSSNACADVYFTTTNTIWKLFKGRSEASSPDSTLWRQPEFNDSSWMSAPAPFYYADTPTEPPFYHGGAFNGTTLTDMLNNYNCVFLRKTFVVTNVSLAGAVTVQAAGDDGFIVWLNGTEVARTNMAPGHIPYNGGALASLQEPRPILSFILTNGPAWLRDGANVLAVQAFNWVSNSSDFGIMAGLSAELDNTPPAISSVDPLPGLTLAELTSVRVVFSEAVSNVHAADLLINGGAATALGSNSVSEYLFSFPQPPTGTVTVAWAPAHGIQDRNGNYFDGGLAWNYGLDTNATGSALISEFMAENGGALLDENGESPDWIEVHNPGPVAMNLNNWSLTDDPGRLTKWQFPAITLPPSGYLIVFASAKNRRVAGAPLHTNFRLEASGGYLALVQSNGVTIVSEFAPTYPKQRTDVSFGLSAGSSALVYFPTPTPGGANGTGAAGFVADTSFSPDRGFYFGSTNVTMRSPTPGATLVYTLNGTEPSPNNGAQVNAPDPFTPPSVSILISNTTLVRAMAFKNGFLATDIDTHSYIFLNDVVAQARPGWLPSTWPGGFPADFAIDARVVNTAPAGFSFTNGLLSLPTISIVMPSNDLFSASTGIYANSTAAGPAWEKRTAAEMIFPDGRAGFQINCGIRMHGHSSRDKNMTPKHSFSLLFRDEFGPSKLDFPIFTNSSVRRFDQLILRACSTDSWLVFDDIISCCDPFPRWSRPEASFMRDQWMRDASLEMGFPGAHGLYVHLYLDGLYWGVYNLTERPDDSFAASHLGGDKSEYDSIADGRDVHAGTASMWDSLMQVAAAGLGSDAAYQRVQGNNPDGTRNLSYPVLIHLTNLIDDMILHIHSGAVDWPHHNWWAARRQGTNSEGFRFFVWDQEISNNSLTRQRVDTPGNPLFAEVNGPNSPAAVYGAMRQNAEFRMTFADRIHKHLFNHGALTVSSNVARWERRHAEMDRGMVGESARWGDFRRPAAPFKREVEWTSNKNWIVSTYFPSNHTLAVKRFRDAGLYPSLGAPHYSQSGGNVPAGYPMAITHTNAAGTIYYTLDGTDPRLRGGGLSGAALVYSQPVPLISPTLVRARVRNGMDWSPIVEARFVTPQDFFTLRISELHYNPPMFNGVDGEEFEFMELENTGTNTLDLGGLTFSSGINFTFTNETLLTPGSFFVLARNVAQFAARFPAAPRHGLFTGKLENGGEMLTLAGPSGSVVFSNSYDDVLPWPLAADGSGLSLQRVNLLPLAAAPNNWTAASPTPGAALPAELVDTDGDGMTDVWEQAHMLDPQDPADAAQDNDNDGSSNLAEFRAGTNPTDATDSLKFTQVELASVNDTVSIILKFRAAPDRSYSILWRDAPHQGCWKISGTISSEPTAREVAVTNTVTPDMTGRFYRIVTPAGVPSCME